MKKDIETFVNSDEFNKFNIPFGIKFGDLKNYRDDKLPNTSGIYFLYCKTLGVSYLGMTETNVNKRFYSHIGRADAGKDFDKNNPHRVWDYFHAWCNTEKYSLEKNSKYAFIYFLNPITKFQLKTLESRLIYKFDPLLNNECFDWFGFNKLEKLRGSFILNEKIDDSLFSFT